MISLEQQVKQWLSNNDVPYFDNTGSPDMPDFTINFPGSAYDFMLEVKEKRQPVKISNWPRVDTRDEDILILDELTARRLMQWSPSAGVLFRDNITKRFVFMDVSRLWLMPRTRVNRRMSEDSEIFKGKWMLNSVNGVVTKSLDVVMRAVREYGARCGWIADQSQCLNTFAGETVQVGGEVRTKRMKEYDYNATR